MDERLLEFSQRLRRRMDGLAASKPWEQGRAYVSSDSGLDSTWDWESAALELFRLQWSTNDAYRRYGVSSGVALEEVSEWRQIPAVPTVAFRELLMTSIPEATRTRVFHSSGTTSQRPSRHFHDDESLAVYETSLANWFRVGFLESPSRPGEVDVHRGGWTAVSLTPPPADVPHSSLVHMLETVGRRWGSGTGRFLGCVGREGGWELDPENLDKGLREAIAAGLPVMLMGTAFSFVHALDFMERQGLRYVLPEGSRVMETGGYKGRSRELAPTELRSGVVAAFGIPLDSVIGEYGMSELSSQAYDAPGLSGEFGRRVFVFPPWARAVVISPETGREVAEGEVGLLRILDLANVASVMAVQTEDRAVRRGGGIELLGRAPASEPRGCSLMAIEAVGDGARV